MRGYLKTMIIILPRSNLLQCFILFKFGFNHLVGSKVIQRDMINQPRLLGKEVLGKHFNSGLDKSKVIKVHLYLNIKQHFFEVLPDEIPLS